MSSTEEVKYLVFDIESVADGDTIREVRYPKLDLSPQESIDRFRQELLSSSGRDFIPYTFHIPIAVVIAKLRADFSIVDIVSLDQPEHRPHVITQHFWNGWQRYDQPTWVTFNGRTFDIPLMELAAFRYGVAVPAWFNMNERAYSQKRNRYNTDSHLDLHELITNFGSTWFRGGLNLAAYLLGKPGKMDVQGSMVQDMYAAGQVGEINEYCRCDVLDTYFVLLRFMVLTGKITIEKEKELTSTTKTLLESESATHPAYKTYLDSWQEWHNPFAE